MTNGGGKSTHLKELNDKLAVGSQPTLTIKWQAGSGKSTHLKELNDKLAVGSQPTLKS
jgi:thymidylate kinase